MSRKSAGETYEKIIRTHLYEEGPSKIAELCGVLGLSKSHASKILSQMRDLGVADTARLGNPPAQYWILADDLHA